MSIKPSIILVANDLMRQSRILEGARVLGYEVTVADTEALWREALDGSKAQLVVLDLQAVGLEWRPVVSAARQQGLPILAFGQHTDAEALRQAREAGCDFAVARSAVVEKLAQLLERAHRHSR